MRQTVLIFMTLLSCCYSRGTAYKDGYHSWSKDCHFHLELTGKLDTVLGKIRYKIGKSYDLEDQTLEEYQMTQGRLKGLDNFERRGPYRCSLSKEFVKIYFRIGFTKLVVSYVLSVVDDLISGFMGGIGSDLSEIFGRVVDFLLNILLPDVYVNVVIRHQFGSKGAYLTGFYVYSTDKFTLQNMEFSSQFLRPYFAPVIDHVLKRMIADQVQIVFRREFRKVTIGRHMISYSTRKEYEYYVNDNQE